MNNDGAIEIMTEGKLLKFTDHNTNCMVVYNISNKMVYNLAYFSCGNRGKGEGLKLLYYSLKYIQTNIPSSERPFRIELSAIPQASNPSENDFLLLSNYYKKLGFTTDTNAVEYGVNYQMYANLDVLANNIKSLLNNKKAGKSKRKTQQRKTQQRKTQQRKTQQGKTQQGKTLRRKIK
jgi:hypothetical protein